MKKIILILFLFSFLQTTVKAQLLPSIGLNHLPSDTEVICNIPWYLGSFYSSGLAENTYAHDFKLYNLQGDSLVLSQKLAKGKPVLLIAGSLTCPVFMGKIPVINQVISTYGNKIQVFVIYTLEAHPTDTSVYFGYVNVGTSNTNSGILFPQPTTYAQRKHLADTMKHWATLNAEVFLDGPCNEWWSVYGPAPNNAYLIDTNGQIKAKHAWFSKYPDNIFCDIDSLLGLSSGLCSNSANGNFTINLINSSISGNPNSILYTYAKLVNNSASDVVIGIKKLQKNLPSGWLSAFCADACYSPTDDSITVTIPAYDTILFSMDFITAAIPDSGSVKVGFRNVNNSANGFLQTFKATTVSNSEVENIDIKALKLFPNPADDIINVSFDKIIERVGAFNTKGQYFPLKFKNNQIDISSLQPGIYLLKIESDNCKQFIRFIKNKKG